MWFVELITLEDFGNGASIFIFINVIGSISGSANEFCSSFMHFSYLNTLNFFVKKVLIHWCSVFFIVLLQTVYKKISIISVKELNLITSGGKQIRKNTLKSSYIPLKLTQGEGMPLVFSSLIISFFHYLIWVILNPIVKNNSWFTLFSFFLVSMSIIIFFNTFYSLLVLKPNDIAENITKMTYSIPGIKEGNQSIQYLKQSIFRLAFLGGTFLLLPVFLSNFFSKKFQFNFLSNVNSLLFLTGLILEITLQLKGYLISEKYEEFKNF